jgi:hypothetical protein
MRIATVALVMLSLAPVASAERLPVPPVPDERLPPAEPIEMLDDPSPPTATQTPPVVPAPPPFDFEGHWRPVYELVWRHGGPSVFGVTSDSKNAFGLAAGLHRSRLSLLGEYSLGGIGYHPSSLATLSPARSDGSPVTVGSDGLMHRFGAVARWAYAKGQSDVESGGFQGLGDLYVDVGAGVEVIRWDDGGTLLRPDLAFGIGGETGFRVSKTQRGTLAVALRMHVARRDDRDNLAATCAAPCTWPSAPTAWSDRSYMLELGYTFGP